MISLLNSSYLEKLVEILDKLNIEFKVSGDTPNTLQIIEPNIGNNKQIFIDDMENDFLEELGVPIYCCYVKIYGGLGNQLFQLCTAKAYCKRENKRLKILTCEEKRGYHWDTALEEYKQFVSKKPPSKEIKVYREPFFNYKKIPSYDQDVLIDGYFQSSKYFDDFVPKVCLPENSRFPDNYVIVHARRGDYCYPPYNVLFHNPQPDEYYFKAKKFIEENEISNPRYILLSDDDNYWKQSPVFKKSDHEILNKDMYSTLSIFKAGKNFIISNSTFAWWGVYLNDRNPEEKMVIAPEKWFGPAFTDNWTDIYEKNWIRL